MSNVISLAKVFEHERLTERLGTVRVAVGSARADAELPASATLVAAVAAVQRDVYRLVSREPGARSLSHLPPGAAATHRQLGAVLRDAQLWLDLFRLRHLDHDDATGEEWVTIEALQDLSEQRQQKKTYPRD